MTSSPTPREAGAECGSALVEVLAAIAVLAVVVAGAHPLHRAAARAQLRAAELQEAVGVAVGAVERLRAGTVAPSSELVVIGAPSVLSWRAAACDDGTDLQRVRATAVPIDALVAVDRPPALRLALDGTSPTSGVEVTVLRADGSSEQRWTDSDGCLVVPVDDGPVRVVHGVDPAAPPTLDLAVAGAPSTTVRSVVTPLGDLVVHAAASSGAELPHEVDGGGLGWWIVDDPAGRTAAPGLPLRVPAGQRAVVVGACDDPRAGGASSVVDVAPDGLTVSEVTLPTIEVGADHAGAGRRLVVQRDRPCPGNGVRPSLRWALTGGAIRAAVPDGRWQVRIEAADGRTLVGPVAILLSGPDTVVPAW